MALRDVGGVVARLERLRSAGIWPNGQRYLWTDAFGVLVLLALHRELRESRWLDEARWVVREVDRVLGRDRGFRIGEQPERDGQYFHYNAMWIFALTRLSRLDPSYRVRALEVVRDIHQRFVVPGFGVYWKMTEDLSSPYPGSSLGAIDPFHGYVVYRLLAEHELAREIGELRHIVEAQYHTLDLTQDLGLGMMLWLSHFFPREHWAVFQKRRALETLDAMWIEPPGYFCRDLDTPRVKLAFSNFGVGVGLQAVHVHEDRVKRLHAFFDAQHESDPYDREAITHVMACASHLPGMLVRQTDILRLASGW